MTDIPRKTLGPIIDRRLAKEIARSFKSRKPLAFQIQGEQLEPRTMLAGHAVAAAFAEPAFFAAAVPTPLVSIASIAAHNQVFGQFGSSSSSPVFSASLTDSNGDTATVTFQTGNLLGVSESVITVTGNTVAEGTSVSVTINNTAVGTIAINSSGTGTLIVATSSLTTTVAAGSTVSVGTLSGTFAASTTPNPGGGGCGDFLTRCGVHGGDYRRQWRRGDGHLSVGQSVWRLGGGDQRHGRYGRRRDERGRDDRRHFGW